jgi:hypothetical protein
VCACFFVGYSSWFFVHLETYIHESVNLSPWYPCSLTPIFLCLLVFGGVDKNLIYECLFIFKLVLCTCISWLIFGLKFVLMSVLVLINTLFLMYVSKWYWGSEDSMFVHIVFKCKNSFVHEPWGASLFHLEYYLDLIMTSCFVQICSLDLLIACFICWSFLNRVILLQSLILNIVWFPPSICRWIRAFDSTHILRNAHLREELMVYWPSKFVAHFGTCCQWGRSLEGLREMVLYLRLVCS